MRINGKCRNCGNSMSFDPFNDKASDIQFCKEKCWEEAWIQGKTGLIHPNHREKILEQEKLFGGRKTCDSIFEKVNFIS